MTKQQAISQMIIDRVHMNENGRLDSAPCTNAVRDAVDFVLGAGTYDSLVSDLYDDLRAKA